MMKPTKGRASPPKRPSHTNPRGSMSSEKVKERVLEAVRRLPDDATVEDAMERLYFLAKVEEGIRQADAGKTVNHEEARCRILG
jgi:hypothetical protein